MINSREARHCLTIAMTITPARNRLLMFASLSLLAACASSAAPQGFVSDPGTPDLVSPTDAGGATRVGLEAGSLGSLGDAHAPTVDAGPPRALLYAHTNTKLFQLDPLNVAAAPVLLGDFDCIGSGSGKATSMTDIAVEKNGKLYGVSAIAAYPLTVQAGVVHCDATWPLPQGSSFYGLTFAPENTVAAQEVLVAANGGGELFEIDSTTGNTTKVGAFGVDPATKLPWSLSGDIVFLANGGNPVGFATVRTCKSGSSGCSTVDTLIEIDVRAIKPGKQSVTKAVRGKVTTGAWCTNPQSPAEFDTIYGIAAYGDKVYGFTHTGGHILEMHNDDATACLVSSDAALSFAGAGVTTVAPVRAPPPPPPPK